MKQAANAYENSGLTRLITNNFSFNMSSNHVIPNSFLNFYSKLRAIYTINEKTLSAIL